MASHEATKVLRAAGEATIQVSLGSGVTLGDGRFTVIAGPCALENADQVEKSATAVKQAGAHVLRGGAFKPRTSPYAFQGLGEMGLKLLAEQGKRHRMPVISEVMDVSQLSLMMDYVDVLQIGARNMHNFSLLREVAKTQRPVVLKRGFGATLEEWLHAAEYLLDGGNDQVILCERGIRSFDTTLRNTLDLAGMAWVKERSKLPVIVDPSHSTGVRSLVIPMALAAAAAGADGLMVEVHPTPETALCDGPQALTPAMFGSLMQTLPGLLQATGRKLSGYEALTAVGS
ncbi:MAG: 3-deoxy-7-phosphoheptulonate synthase [Archangium sp.]|nr:3-deoxy-7-phosphoheptulonate synthase [Archangium sp.]MDP3573364.1 3-deoxy-7-phosphoheptulonate synthase [Archangium sp.]